MTALEKFGAFLAPPRPLADDVRALLRLHVADTVVAWVAAGNTPDGRALRDLLASVESEGVNAAVAINCAITRMSEIDDIHLASMITPGSIVVPAAASMAAQMPGVSGETLSRAIVAGYEAMIRFGIAINGPVLLARGVWPTYFATPLGVAAAASVLMGLDAKQTAHALAIALAKSIPGVGKVDDVVKGRWLAAGEAAAAGLEAARAAKEGAKGSLDLLESGFFQTAHGVDVNSSLLTENLGELIVLREVAFKPWCAARQTMAAVQSFREMISGIDTASIEQVEAHVPPVFLKMLDHGVHPDDRLSRLTSMPFQIAIAAFDPDAAFNVGQTQTVGETVQAFMNKVKVVADEKLMAGFPSRWRGVVRVNENGVWGEHEALDVPGDPVRPLDEKAVLEKFRRVSALPGETCDTLIDEAFQALDGRISASKLLANIEGVRN